MLGEQIESLTLSKTSTGLIFNTSIRLSIKRRHNRTTSLIRKMSHEREIEVISSSDPPMHFFPHLMFHTAFPLKYSPFEDLIRGCSGYSSPELIKHIAQCPCCCTGILPLADFSGNLQRDGWKQGQLRGLPWARRAGLALLGG